MVVRSQQEQQREGKSYVGALGHVLVRHFPLWGRNTIWVIRANYSFDARALKHQAHGRVEGQGDVLVVAAGGEGDLR